jgi:protein-disulfide isomerase-like protein with CxxC motif
MNDKPQITYLFDPLCGWCYGASRILAELATSPDLAIGLAPVGLFSGEGARQVDAHFAAYAWSHDQRIASITGQSFTGQYRRNVLGKLGSSLDSGPANLALNLDMTIAIVDSGSNLVYLERSNQAGIGTIDAAIGKAKASLEAFCGHTIEERLMSDRVGGLAASI